MKKAILIFLTVTLLAGFCLPVSAGLVPCGLSEDDPNQPGDQTEACTSCHLFIMMDTIIDYILIFIVPSIAVLMIVIGGAYYVVSQGSSEKLSKAKSIFVSVAIGLLIVYGAWIIVNFFMSSMGVAEWTGLKNGWWKINCSTSTSPTPTQKVEEKIKEKVDDVIEETKDATDKYLDDLFEIVPGLPDAPGI